MGNDYSLSGFIEAAERNGLPVRFLREVVKGYALKTADDDDDRVKPALNRLYLSANTLSSVQKMAPTLPFGEAPGIQTIYHEATHAYFDLKQEDPSVASLLADCTRYYEAGSLSNGETI